MIENQTKKIIIFSPFYPPHIGGVENYTKELSEKLAQNGIAITIFTPRLPQSCPEQESQKNMTVIRFPAFEIIPNYPLPKFWNKDYRRLSKALRQEKFDICISQTRFFSTSLLAYFFSNRKNIRWIHIEHGADFVQNNKVVSGIAWIYDMTIGKIIIQKAELIAISEAVKRFIQKLVPGKECSIIYRGYDIKHLDAIAKNEELENKFGQKTKLVYIGRLVKGKGVIDLIQALKKIENKNFICFIIGDGPERPALEKETEKLGLTENIIFFGSKKFEEAIGILKISDIFINPSYTEGLPTTVLEAALCRKAIVATDVGGTSEIVENEKSGILVNPKDIAALTEKIEILMNNESLRKEFGAFARQKAIVNFDWDRNIETFLDKLQTK